MAKKSDKSKAPEKSEVEKRVDAMMSLEPEKPESDVAELAEQVNKQFLSDKPEVAEDTIQVKVQTPKTAPVLASAEPASKPVKKEAPKVESPQPAELTPAQEAAEPVEPAIPAVPEEDIPPAGDPGKPADEFDDKETDKAVDDIAEHESDMVLAVEDAKVAKKQEAAHPANEHKHRVFWTIIGILSTIILIVLALLFMGDSAL